MYEQTNSSFEKTANEDERGGDPVQYRLQVMRRLLGKRGSGLLHVLTGLRGCGKTRLVHDILNRLEQRGEQTRYLSLEEPEFRWVRNGCDFFLMVKKMFEFVSGPIFLVLDEPAVVPYMSAAIGSLAADSRFELLVVSSTKSILSVDEIAYFSGRINFEELLPVEKARRCPLFEILVKDVFREPGIPDVRIVERVIEYLAVTVGTEHTQRAMLDFVARERSISKNTPARCVNALVNTHVIRALPKFDLFEGSRSSKGGVKYCFTDSFSRRTNFGRLSLMAEAFDESAAKLARVGEVCWVDDMPGVVDFVTLRQGRVEGCWRATPEGPVAVANVGLLFGRQG